MTRFAGWFAPRGLFRRGERGRTALVCAPFLLLAAAGTAWTGWCAGADRAARAALARDLCLWAHSPDPLAPVSPEQAEAVRALGHPWAPVPRLVREWCEAGAGPCRSGPPAHGRAVVAGDERFFAALPFRGAKPDFAPGWGGVVVTPRLLARLGADPAAPPPELSVRSPTTGRPVGVGPVFVTADDFLPPGSLLFAVSDATADRLDRAAPQGASASADTGPVPEAWWDPQALPAEARRRLAEVLESVYGLDYPPTPVETEAGKVWRLATANRQPLPPAEWAATLAAGLPDVLRAAGVGVPPGFAEYRLVAAPGPAAPPEARAAHTLAIYPRTLEGLGGAAAGAEAAGLRVDRDRLNELSRLEESSARRRATADEALAAAGVVAWMVAAGVLVLRVLSRAAALGVLRALGLGGGPLALAAAAEAGLVWACGVLPGHLAGLAAGAAAGDFAWTAPQSGAVLGGGALAAAAAVAVAYAAVAARPPAANLSRAQE